MITRSVRAHHSFQFLTRTSIAATVALLAVACGGDEEGDGDGAADAGGIPGECFPGGVPDGATEEGSVEIGTGEDQMQILEPEQELVLIHGLQGLFHFEIRTRIYGLDGGEIGDTDPDNLPATLVTAYDAEGVRLDGNSCGFRTAYEPGEEYSELPYIRPLVFGLASRPADGDRVRIVAEVYDQSDRYATSEVWVTTLDQE